MWCVCGFCVFLGSCLLDRDLLSRLWMIFDDYGVRCTESLIQRFVWVLHLAECVLVPRKQNQVSGIFLTRSAHCSWHGVSWCHMFLSTLAGIDWRDLVEPLILGVFGALSLCSVGKSGDIW